MWRAQCRRVPTRSTMSNLTETAATLLLGHWKLLRREPRCSFRRASGRSPGRRTSVARSLMQPVLVKTSGLASIISSTANRHIATMPEAAWDRSTSPSSPRRDRSTATVATLCRRRECRQAPANPRPEADGASAPPLNGYIVSLSRRGVARWEDCYRGEPSRRRLGDLSRRRPIGGALSPTCRPDDPDSTDLISSQPPLPPRLENRKSPE